MSDKSILLVEDNPDDEALTLCALMKNNILNPVTIVRDGAEALDYLFCQGAFIAGDRNKNISVHINHTPDNTPTPAWRKVAALLAWLATLAGTVIAALAYWLPRGGS